MSEVQREEREPQNVADFRGQGDFETILQRRFELRRPEVWLRLREIRAGGLERNPKPKIQNPN